MNEKSTITMFVFNFFYVSFAQTFADFTEMKLSCEKAPS